MMVKYRWFQLTLPISLRELRKALSTVYFGRKLESGFIQLPGALDGEEFRFFWRARIARTSFNDRAEPSFDFVETTKFCDFSFVDRPSRPYLRVANPPRTSRELLNSLELLIGLGFTAELVNFNASELAQKIPKLGKARLIGIKATIRIEEQEAIGRLELAARESLRPEELSFFYKRNPTLESMVYEITVEGLRGQLALSSSGIARITGRISPLLRSNLEDLVLR